MSKQLTSTKGKVPTGYADEIVISETTFRAGHRAFEGAGATGRKRKREGKGDSSVVYGAGAYKGPWARYEEEQPDASSGSEEEVEVEYEEDEIAPQLAAPPKVGTAYQETDSAQETTEFHGSQLYDYQGRSYLHVPKDLDVDLTGDVPSDFKNYAPKKCIHTYKYHTKAVNQLRFFPGAGHLLLSCSADSKVALWDVYHQRELLRSYSGHTKSVSDIDFNYDGTRFLTASFDRQMKLWDTETGTCISKFSTGATPNVIRWNPSAAAPTEFLAGMSDKKIVQFDTREPGTTKQEYDHHLGPVNTITFVDEDRRFVTTSDDRSLRAWEYGIPVPIKFISDPEMFPMTRSSPHPSNKYIAFQEANKILVYASTDRFRQNRKKVFQGHNTAGYAIDVAVSPDGGMVMSGDTGGFVCFWDWKTTKMWHKVKASDSAVLSTAWQPRESSKVATGALDGVIKYWD